MEKFEPVIVEDRHTKVKISLEISYDEAEELFICLHSTMMHKKGSRLRKLMDKIDEYINT